MYSQVDSMLFNICTSIYLDYFLKEIIFFSFFFFLYRADYARLSFCPDWIDSRVIFSVYCYEGEVCGVAVDDVVCGVNVQCDVYPGDRFSEVFKGDDYIAHVNFAIIL